MQSLGTITSSEKFTIVTADTDRAISEDLFNNIQTLSGSYENTSPITPSEEIDSVTTIDFLSKMNYLWENYSNFSLLPLYLRIKDYEKKNGYDSEVLLKKWQEGNLIFNTDINDWLSTYLQIRKFIHES